MYIYIFLYCYEPMNHHSDCRRRALNSKPSSSLNAQELMRYKLSTGAKSLKRYVLLSKILDIAAL